mmetsp:Transcript_107971/g.305311  ORF Transcript_107971/g.305311 Transcript_107971/m.305311 type:complete len:265 (-) Transcript_107971:38-832(-)
MSRMSKMTRNSVLHTDLSTFFLRKCAMKSEYLIRCFPPAISLNTASISSKQLSSLRSMLPSMPGSTHSATAGSCCTARIISSSEMEPFPSVSILRQITRSLAAAASSSASPPIGLLSVPLRVAGLCSCWRLRAGEGLPPKGDAATGRLPPGAGERPPGVKGEKGDDGNEGWLCAWPVGERRLGGWAMNVPPGKGVAVPVTMELWLGGPAENPLVCQPWKGAGNVIEDGLSNWGIVRPGVPVIGALEKYAGGTGRDIGLQVAMSR